ncbi:hypothetical protein K2173_018362 [Erythroxylum novogranatense]|uniref:Uncharacterized protein n=1 Tax=Erythroxylum novogranatense TaxID=1862640 RepID=A0AAV8UAE2_9ROSI|nr:hypothetical protein K2173_018362 [Erythroxylum novogranatense]
MEWTEIETSADSIDGSVIFHLTKSIIGFVLYMHQQIPSTLQDTNLEFDALQAEYKELEVTLTQTELKASSRRKVVGRMREVNRGIRRLEKVVNTVSRVDAALQQIISEIPGIESVVIALGPTPARPQFVYELCFSHGNRIGNVIADFIKTRLAEGLSRKVIRMLISKDAGSGNYPGPTKLFLLVKAPASCNLPLHFLPKRDFRCSKKVVPFRLRVKCRSQDLKVDDPDCTFASNSLCSTECSSNDLIWFQCRHVVRGLAFKTTAEE